MLTPQDARTTAAHRAAASKAAAAKAAFKAAAEPGASTGAAAQAAIEDAADAAQTALPSPADGADAADAAAADQPQPSASPPEGKRPRAPASSGVAHVPSRLMAPTASYLARTAGAGHTPGGPPPRPRSVVVIPEPPAGPSLGALRRSLKGALDAKRRSAEVRRGCGAACAGKGCCAGRREGATPWT
jgi:hypothetical protein